LIKKLSQSETNVNKD